MERSNNNKIIAAAIVIAAVVLIALAASIFSKKEENSQSETSETSQSANTAKERSGKGVSDSTSAESSESYKNGSYTVSDTYSSPGGIEDIKVTLTLSGNTITDVSVVQEANNDESAEYQEKFQKNYKSLVVGKALSNLELSRSSGASLTTNAFNDALDQIRSQAKA